MPLFGAHESVSKGLHFAFDRIIHVGGEALQIFTRNQRQWNPKELATEEAQNYAEAWKKHGKMPVASHASYLINLATGKNDLLQKSVRAFIGELQRCQKLLIPYVVIHPGSHGGDGVDSGIERFTRGLDEVIDQADSDTMVLIETTAGQGTSLGSTFEELAFIRTNSRFPRRIGICLDTCHIFAAGYDIRTAEQYTKTMADFDRLIGLEHLHFFHLNDSKKDLGSRVDRHEHIGHGCIGPDGFRWLVNDERFTNHPMTLETPKGDDLQEDIANLKVLRELVGT